MKYCPFCGSGLDDEMIFCPKCGKRFRGAQENAEGDVLTMEITATPAKETTPQVAGQGVSAPITEHAETATDQAINETKIVSPPSREKSKKPLIIGIVIAAIILIAVVLCVLFLNDSNSEYEDIPNVVVSTDANEGDVVDDTHDGKIDISVAAKSVLFLETYDDDGNLVATASGFIARDRTTLITNYHVIDGAYRIVAFTPNKEASIEVKTLLAYDSVLDLAILECAGDIGVTPLVLGDSDSVLQGDPVYAVGYPLGVAHTLSDGVVGSRYTDDNGVDTIQITAAISSGSSGGALFNESSEVVGVICASYVEGQNLNLAIAANELLTFMDCEHLSVPLADYYKKNETYGITQANLACGCNVVENDEYVFYVKDNFIYQRDKGTGRTIEIAEGRYINLYKNKLYYLDCTANDIVNYDLRTMESEYMNIFSNKQIEDPWLEGEYWFEESANEILIAEDVMFLSVSFFDADTDELWTYSLVAVDINDPTNIIYVSDVNIRDFNYCNGSIYAGVANTNQILVLNMKTLEEEFIEAPCNNVVIEGADDNYFYFTAYWDLNGNVLYRGTPGDQVHFSYDEIKFIKNPNGKTYASYCIYENEVYCFIRCYEDRTSLRDENGKLIPLKIKYTSFCKYNSDEKIELISAPNEAVTFWLCGIYENVVYFIFNDEPAFNLLTGEFQ